MDQIRNGEPRRNAMQQFVAKFEKDIQGVMSGFDRVLFRGSLRRLTHSLGMKWYLSQNDILCKQYEDHVKQISQKVKQAGPESRLRRRAPAPSGNRGAHSAARAGNRCRRRRASTRA